MKKAIIATIALIGLFSFQSPNTQRFYQFAVPENYARQAVLLVQGHSEQVSAADSRLIEDYIVNQYLQQSRNFYVQDSTKAAQSKGKH